MAGDPTARQVEALTAVITTGTNGAAGAMLGISPRTIGVHLANLRKRLGVDTTVQATYVMTARGEIVAPSVGRRGT